MESQKLEIGKNNEISYFEMISKQSDVGIIIIHGLAEHKGRYIELIEKLHALKFSVFALDLIGHGEDLHKKGDINNFIEFIDQLDQFVSNIKKR